jgi:hypothetical protein
MTPPNLAATLEDFHASLLGAMLNQAGVANVPKAKSDKIQLWLRLVGDPQRIQAALARLTPAQRRALEILQLAGGEIRTDRFRSRLAVAGVATAKAEPTYGYGVRIVAQTPKPSVSLPLFAQVLEDLLREGLIWTHTLREGQPGSAKIDFTGGRYVYIPKEVARHLPPLPIKQSPAPLIAQTLEGSARTCQRDLYLLWSAARETPLQLVNAGLLRIGDLKRVAGQLLVPETIVTGGKEFDYRRLFFLRRLATALDVLREDSSSNRVEGLPAPSFISETPSQRVRISYQRWRDGGWWNELTATLPSSSAPPANVLFDAAPAPVLDARLTVLKTLALLTRQVNASAADSAWVTVADVSDYLRDRDNEFLIDAALADQRSYSYGYGYYGSLAVTSRYEYNTLGWSWPQYASDEHLGWQQVEQSFIRAVLTEGLYWLGLVDLGYTEPVTQQGGAAPANVTAVRLTDMGRWLLLDAPQPEIPEESGRVVVQPNFRIFAFDPISDTVLARLDSFAIRRNAERAIEYELSRETLYRAQLAGQTAEQVQHWLEQATGAALPQNVARSLAEWQAAFERITVRSRVGWLEAAAPELVDVLLHDARWNKAIVKRATPTGLIVRADRIDELEQVLVAAGELPTRHKDPDADSRASIAVEEDGRITLSDTAPSLYVQGFLRPFCEWSPAGWQITARSVAAANAAGLDAATLLARLQVMAVKGTPAALQARIKAWSQHYGAATVQVLTLVQFRDQDVLDELRSDPQLARLLKPFKPEARLGLAVLASADVAKATALLSERGVAVQA